MSPVVGQGHAWEKGGPGLGAQALHPQTPIMPTALETWVKGHLQ